MGVISSGTADGAADGVTDGVGFWSSGFFCSEYISQNKCNSAAKSSTQKKIITPSITFSYRFCFFLFSPPRLALSHSFLLLSLFFFLLITILCCLPV
ncbi:MAG: hypothetical protein NC254_09420 [bacterium]|nr:hypothetical protein [bacterium]